LDEISIVLPRVLDGRLRALARLCGRDEKDIIRVALDDYLGRVTILSQPVQYQLPDGLWVVEALEKALKGLTERAIKAEDRVDTLQIVAKENYRMYENTLAENAKLRAALSKVEDMCVSFHEDGPYQDNEEVRRIMEIYDIAHSALEGGGADG